MREFDHELYSKNPDDYMVVIRACGFEGPEEVQQAIQDLNDLIISDLSIRYLAIILTVLLSSMPSIFIYLLAYPGMYDQQITGHNLTKVVEIIDSKLRYLLEMGITDPVYLAMSQASQYAQILELYLEDKL